MKRTGHDRFINGNCIKKAPQQGGQVNLYKEKGRRKKLAPKETIREQRKPDPEKVNVVDRLIEGQVS